MDGPHGDGLGYGSAKVGFWVSPKYDTCQSRLLFYSRFESFTNDRFL